MIKDLLKSYFKKNAVSIIAIAIIAAVIVIKFAVPILLALGIVIIALGALYVFKGKSQKQVGGDNVTQIQYSEGKNHIQIQKGGANSKQTQIHN